MTNKATFPYPGSRWWKCDFHIHTPGSADFRDASTTPQDWVAAAKAAGLEAIAITDHNGPGWLDEIRVAAALQHLIVFPGFEISVSGGIHLLGIFDLDTTRDAITAILGKCGIRPEQIGTKEACSTRSITEVADEIAKHEGLCLAAHVNGEAGVLSTFLRVRPDAEPTGNRTLQDFLTSRSLCGIEVVNPSPEVIGFLDNSKDGYRRPHGPLPLLEGSDAHRLADIGRRFTWVKMSKPNLEGLRLALLDGPMSVHRGSAAACPPNSPNGFMIESLTVENARYMGRPGPFTLPFSPWLTCIIGGHGTGKSTALEFLRHGLQRATELPSALTKEHEKYGQAYKSRRDEGLLMDGTVITVLYRRDGGLFRIRWTHGDRRCEAEAEQIDGTWAVTPADVSSRFPIRIFSQKQIYRLAQDPNAILRYADESPLVDAANVRRECERLETHFLALRAQVRDHQTRLGDEGRLQGEVADVRRRIQQIEDSGQRELLAAYQLVERQRAAFDAWSSAVSGGLDRFERNLQDLTVPVLPEDLFETNDAELPYREVLNEHGTAGQVLRDVKTAIESQLAIARNALSAYDASRTGGRWATHVEAIRSRYAAANSDVAAGSTSSTQLYGQLVAREQELSGKLVALDATRATVVELESESSATLQQLREARGTLTSKRRQFLDEVKASEARVQISVLPFGDGFDAEVRFRELIGKSDDSFREQIWSEEDRKGLLFEVYRPEPRKDTTTLLDRLDALKSRLLRAVSGSDDGSIHGKFLNFLRKLPPEVLDRVQVMFPEDAVEITYQDSTSKDFRPLSQGSPGQKSAAILSFILAYGDEPLLFDQPEDDLDGSLISELIVQQLRENKKRRQLIVVTHDPNIVVNGDAEFVLPFVVEKGQTKIAEDGGGLQEQRVRDEICRVMEGGSEALDRRYRRIRGSAASH